MVVEIGAGEARTTVASCMSRSYPGNDAPTTAYTLNCEKSATVSRGWEGQHVRLTTVGW